MFRDLKEYQDIAKIYAEKVSKPENLEENQANRMKMKALRTSNTPKTREEVGLKNNVVKKPSPFERKFGAEKNQQRLKQSGLAKPSTAEIRAKNPNVVPGTRVNEVGAKGGGKPSEGDFKKDFPDKKPEVSKLTKQGKPRTKAQMMAAKRIAAGKTIQQVKDENKASMKAKAKERFAAFKAKRAAKGGDAKPEAQAKPVEKPAATQEKPSGNKVTQASPEKAAVNKKEVAVNKKEVAVKKGVKSPSNTSSLNVSAGTPTRKVTSSTTQSGNTTSTKTKVTSGTGGGTAGLTKSAGSLEDNKKKAERMKKIAAQNAAMEKEFEIPESNQFDAYDIVLEYLLSTEQVATIEEANYVMTEMDAETIQGIVESQVNRADITGGTKAAKNAAKGIGKYTPGPGVTKDFKLDPNFKLKGV